MWLRLGEGVIQALILTSIVIHSHGVDAYGARLLEHFASSGSVKLPKALEASKEWN